MNSLIPFEPLNSNRAMQWYNPTNLNTNALSAGANLPNVTNNQTTNGYSPSSNGSNGGQSASEIGAVGTVNAISAMNGNFGQAAVFGGMPNVTGLAMQAMADQDMQAAMNAISVNMQTNPDMSIAGLTAAGQAAMGITDPTASQQEAASIAQAQADDMFAFATAASGANTGGGEGVDDGYGGPGNNGGHNTGIDGDTSGGGEGATVLCTELHRQGLMSSKIYAADGAYGRTLDPAIISGYHAWGKPLVKAMQKSPTVTAIINAIVTPWAEHMAFEMEVIEKDNLLGKLINRTGQPACKLIGLFILRNQPAKALS